MLKSLSFFSLLLCFIPIFSWLTNWQWAGNDTLHQADYLLYLVTQTGTSPFALITCFFFAVCYFWLIPNKKQAVFVIAIMAFSVILTQGIKTGLKYTFAEPRPFVHSLCEQQGVSTEQFYSKDRDERKALVQNFYQNHRTFPSWLVNHHAKETGYSFPSGHSIFAATWLMLALGFYILLKPTLSPNRYKTLRFFTALIFVWSVLMLISRLRLGMHYPIDLLLSILIAWFIHNILFFLLEKSPIPFKHH